MLRSVVCLALAGCQVGAGPVVGLDKRGFVYGWNARARAVSTEVLYRRVSNEAWSAGVGQTFGRGRRWVGYAAVGYVRFDHGGEPDTKKDAARFAGFAEAGVATDLERVLPYLIAGGGASSGGDFTCASADFTAELLVALRYVDTLQLVAMPALGYADNKGQCGD